MSDNHFLRTKTKHSGDEGRHTASYSCYREVASLIHCMAERLQKVLGELTSVELKPSSSSSQRDWDSLLAKLAVVQTMAVKNVN